MSKLFLPGVVAVSLLSPMVFAAENCAALNQTLNFQNNGTVSDSATGLVWSHCHLGQQWNGSACTGSASLLTLGEATSALLASGQSDLGFRLPTLAELQGITAFDCGEPAVHKAWQSIETGFYWTATPAFGGFQNTVLMTNGEEYPMSTDIGARVLLVKNN